MPLMRKLMAPLAALSREEEDAEDTLFLRLESLAATHPAMYDCTVQRVDGEFVVILTEPETGVDVCAWSGSADAVVVEVQSWLARKGAVPSAATSARPGGEAGKAP